MKIALLQNNYNKGTPLIEGLAEYLHENTQPELREFPAQFNLFQQGEHKKHCYLGLLSPKFEAKTGLNGVQVKEFIKNNPGYDCYFINPFNSEVFLNFNVWTQGETCHPGLIERATPALQHAANVNLSELNKSELTKTCYCNFWIANESFWKKFMSFCKQVSDYMLMKPEVYLENTSHDDYELAFYPFIMERLFPTFLAVHPELKVKGLQIDNSESLSAYNKIILRINKSLESFGWENFNSNSLKTYFKSIHASKANEDLSNFPHLARIKTTNFAEVGLKTSDGANLLYFLLKMGEVALEDSHLKNLFQNFFIRDKTLKIPKVFRYIFEIRKDLQKEFQLKSGKDLSRYVDWCCNHGVNEVIIPLLKINCKKNMLDGSHLPKNSKEFGVNLIGFVNAPIGLGEDLRNFAQLLTRAAIPFSIKHLPYRNETPQLFQEYGHRINNEWKYKINILFLPGPEVFSYLNFVQPSIKEGFYNIAYSPWEFDQWHDKLNFFFQDIDEIWAISSFTKKSYTKIPRIKLSHINTLFDFSKYEALESVREKTDGNEPFRFLYIFDSNSSLQRKNPMVLIKAFSLAFPNNEKVELVLKTLHLSSSSELHQSLSPFTKKDPRIKIINEKLSNKEVLSLMAECDAYVSPHRCEGFGRTLVEAMFLKKRVIATPYSGNLDYCREGFFFKLNFNLKPVNSHYPYTTSDFNWADVDTCSLVEQLRNAFYSEQSEINSILEANKDFVEAKYSVESNIANFSERLLKIFKRLNS